MTRTGRRPGPNTTRAALLTAARRRFAAAGYDATSLRVVAADVGVDPAVVLHFFGSKAGLFRAAVGWPFDPALVAVRVKAPDGGDLGAELARMYLELWDDPTIGASLQAVLRSAMTQPESATLLREFVTQQLFEQLRSRVDGPQADLRINLAAAQMIGVAVLRHLLEFEPLASAARDELVGWLGPAIAHYLTALPSAEEEQAPDSGRDAAS